MDDKQLDDLLRGWSDAKIPDENKRENILNAVFDEGNFAVDKGRFRKTSKRGMLSALAVGVAALAILFVILPVAWKSLTSGEDDPEVETVRWENTGETETAPIRVSLLILRRLPGSEHEVEFLEDTIVSVESQAQHEVSAGDHKLFLWLYVLEPSLLTLDIGTDRSSETGIVAVPEKVQAVRLRSNGDEFDVFVSLL